MNQNKYHLKVKKSWFLLFFLLITPITFLSGQGEAESAEGIRFESIQKPGKVRYVREGKKVVVWTKSGEKVKGNLHNIGKEGFEVSGQRFEFAELESIRVRSAVRVATRGFGIAIGLVGFVTFVIGFVLALVAAKDVDSTANGCAALFLFLLAVILAALGATIFLVGLIPFLIGLSGGKRFRLATKWKVDSVKEMPKTKRELRKAGK